MKIYRPLWNEGALLSPQQFQQQSAWEAFTNAGLAALTSPFPWGVEQVEFDETQLASGRAVVQTLRLWLPDGTLIDTHTGAEDIEFAWALTAETGQIEGKTNEAKTAYVKTEREESLMLDYVFQIRAGTK